MSRPDGYVPAEEPTSVGLTDALTWTLSQRLPEPNGSLHLCTNLTSGGPLDMARTAKGNWDPIYNHRRPLGRREVT